MILTYKILVYFATTLAGIEASAPRLREDQRCGIFGRYRDPSEPPCRSGANILKNIANWTELAETELIEDRWRLVIPYVIKPKFSDKPASFWKRRIPGRAKPANAEEWIAEVRPAIKKAAAFYESTNVLFREYSQSDIESGRFDEKQYIVISDFYNTQSWGCTADLGPNRESGYVEVDIERCRNEKGYGSEYHPGLIAHEFMHILGFLHEHQRKDRNRYLKVTIPQYGAEDYQINENGRILTPYDPESITHYGPDEHIQINKDHPKSTNMKLIGQLEKLSKLDVEQINLNYPVKIMELSKTVFITDFEGRVFDIQMKYHQGKISAGAKIIVWDKHGGPNQQFKVDNANNGFYFIRSAANSDLCLEVPDKRYEDSTTIEKTIQLGHCSDVQTADNQLWSISGGRLKKFTTKGADNMVLDSCKGWLCLWTENGGANQWFELRE